MNTIKLTTLQASELLQFMQNLGADDATIIPFNDGIQGMAQVYGSGNLLGILVFTSQVCFLR